MERSIKAQNRMALALWSYFQIYYVSGWLSMDQIGYGSELQIPAAKSRISWILNPAASGASGGHARQIPA